MKSERAEAYINANEMDAAYLVDKDGCGWAVIGIYQARKAVELAEQDAEARMFGCSGRIMRTTSCDRCSTGRRNRSSTTSSPQGWNRIHSTKWAISVSVVGRA